MDKTGQVLTEQFSEKPQHERKEAGNVWDENGKVIDGEERVLDR